jgi:hypothetical protein
VLVMRQVDPGLRPPNRHYPLLSLVRSLSLLGWTRFGSPGIFGVRTGETLC